MFTIEKVTGGGGGGGGVKSEKITIEKVTMRWGGWRGWKGLKEIGDYYEMAGRKRQGYNERVVGKELTERQREGYYELYLIC